MNYQKSRSYFLVAVGISSTLAVLYSLIATSAGNRSVADFKFPQKLQLSSGEMNGVNHDSPSPNKVSNGQHDEQIIAEQQYQGRRSQINLYMSYIVGTRGDVETYLKKYTSMLSTEIKAKEIRNSPVGYYLLFTKADQAYLSSCISPRSSSNVTQKQFSQARYQNDLQLTTLWNWFKGEESIRYCRCLWVLISAPITSNQTQVAYQRLETVWLDVYQWWQPNFPALTNHQ